MLSCTNHIIVTEQIFILFPGARGKISHGFLLLNGPYILLGWEKGAVVSKHDKLSRLLDSEKSQDKEQSREEGHKVLRGR